MTASVFQPFRLVGGTALSLHCGHRMSEDIDMFTDAPYGSIDFKAIEHWLQQHFSYVTGAGSDLVAMGNGYIVGDSAANSIKLDMYYTTDPFMQPLQQAESIRLATIDEIVAMKLDVVQRGGRKKDFWDLHELSNRYTPAQMLHLHKLRYPYTHDEEQIRSGFSNFTHADADFEPICLRGKIWELIKLDLARHWYTI